MDKITESKKSSVGHSKKGIVRSSSPLRRRVVPTTKKSTNPTLRQSLPKSPTKDNDSSSKKSNEFNLSDVPNDILVTNLLPRVKTVTKDLSLRQQIRFAYAMNDRDKLKILNTMSQPKSGEIHFVKVDRVGNFSSRQLIEELSKTYEEFSDLNVKKAITRFHKFAKTNTLSLQPSYPKYVSKLLLLLNDIIWYQYDIESLQHMVRLQRYPKIRLLINTTSELNTPIEIKSIIIDVTKYKDYPRSRSTPTVPIFEDLLLGVHWIKKYVLKDKSFRLSKTFKLGTCEDVPMDKSLCLDLLEKVKKILI